MFPAQAGAAAPVRGTEPSMAVQSGAIYNPRSRTPGAFHADSGSAARFFNAFPIGDDLWVAVPDGQTIIYQAKASKSDRAGSSHPTVKPVALMRWLCRLVTPPGGIVLDPFAGSGSTGQAARDEGFGCVLIEREGDYASDIRRRLNLPAPFIPWRQDPDILALVGYPTDIAELL
jgi:site-specific DNA-methyltransferase (adenine-specific)